MLKVSIGVPLGGQFESNGYTHSLLHFQVEMLQLSPRILDFESTKCCTQSHK